MTDPQPRSTPRHALSPRLIHDLRTPLGQIIGYAELMVEKAEDAGDPSLVPDLRKVSAAGYRMLALIEDHFAPLARDSAFADDGADGAARNGNGHGDGAEGGLAHFILRSREPILAEWEAFARTCTPAASAMDIVALRDHAGEMLDVIARDLLVPQNATEQRAKSLGDAAPPRGGPTAAEEHGAGRAESGFTIEQMVAEYRALRASVIRLWTLSRGGLAVDDLRDLTRFNEAIDQALAESVTRYTRQLNDSKEMFLAILGHDLRTPLSAVLTSALFMLDTGELREPHLTLTARIASSARRMDHMVGALLDFTRSRLGGGIPIHRASMNMGRAVHDAVDEIAAAYPSRTIEVDARGEQEGNWDCARISQVLSNLVINALEHGSDGAVVTVTTRGDDEAITISVHNHGPAIPPSRLNGIFSPMKPRSAAQRGSSVGPSGNLGLGLFIAERIVTAHEGTIQVDSDPTRGTTFTVCLPRR